MTACTCARPVTLADPRKAHSCGRCGRALPVGLGIEHDGPRVAPRDRTFEADWAHSAAHRVRLAAPGQELRDFADRRTDPGGIRQDGRDLVQEFLEEAADSLNYLTWRAQQLAPLEDETSRFTVERLAQATAKVIEAYALARSTQGLL